MNIRIYAFLITLGVLYSCTDSDPEPEIDYSPTILSPLSSADLDYESLTFSWEMPDGVILPDSVPFDFELFDLVRLEMVEDVSTFQTTYVVSNLNPYSAFFWTVSVEIGGERYFDTPSLILIQTKHKVYDGNLALVDQERIEDFSLAGYTKVNGSVAIIGFDELDINGNLEYLYVIRDRLVVANQNLENLGGLNSLDSIGADLIIGQDVGFATPYNNELLTTLDGIDSLSYVGGDVIIRKNTDLTDFCALNKLFTKGTIGGSIIIEENAFNPSRQDFLDGSCKVD